MDHPSLRLLAYDLLSLLDDQQHKMVEEHLQSCNDCWSLCLPIIDDFQRLTAEAIQCPSDELLLAYFVKPESLTLIELLKLYYHLYQYHCPDCSRGGD